MTSGLVLAPSPPRPRRRRRRTFAVIAVVLVAALFVAVTARLFVWPPIAPLPAHVDAIVELGGPGHRDSAALALAREHRADYLVQSTTVEDSRSDTCLQHFPGVTVLCFHAVPGTTRGEAEAIRDLAARYHWHSIILVTTPDQVWRAHLRVSRCFPGSVYAATVPLPVLEWPTQLVYQWAATVKAVAIQRTC